MRGCGIDLGQPRTPCSLCSHRTCLLVSPARTGVCLVLVLVITQGRASLVTEPVEGWTARATGRAGLPLVVRRAVYSGFSVCTCTDRGRLLE